MNTEPFVIERVLNAPVEKVWKAITDRDQMKQWYFYIAEFKPELGFEFSFTGGSDQKTYVHLCKITKIEPNKTLRYSWHYKDHPGDSLVTFELFPEGDHATLVKLTHEGLHTFPIDNKDFARESFSAGWTYIIGQSLKEFVENKS